MGVSVPEWGTHKPSRNRPSSLHAHSGMRGATRAKPAPQHHNTKVGNAIKLLRAVKSKANGSGRTYTSKYRGVHQTFPTKRWEAQFRRNGKPTSLGCFDHEEEAARAYDKMMLWCELHNTAGVKSGITNFDPTEYEKDFAWLQSVSQDELIETLRSEGRRQAAHRMLRQKREGVSESNASDYEDQPTHHIPHHHQPQQLQQQQLQLQQQQQLLIQQQQQLQQGQAQLALLAAVPSQPLKEQDAAAVARSIVAACGGSPIASMQVALAAAAAAAAVSNMPQAQPAAMATLPAMAGPTTQPLPKASGQAAQQQPGGPAPAVVAASGSGGQVGASAEGEGPAGALSG